MAISTQGPLTANCTSGRSPHWTSCGPWVPAAEPALRKELLELQVHQQDWDFPHPTGPTELYHHQHLHRLEWLPSYQSRRCCLDSSGCEDLESNKGPGMSSCPFSVCQLPCCSETTTRSLSTDEWRLVTLAGAETPKTSCQIRVENKWSRAVKPKRGFAPGPLTKVSFFRAPQIGDSWWQWTGISDHQLTTLKLFRLLFINLCNTSGSVLPFKSKIFFKAKSYWKSKKFLHFPQ